LTSIGPLSKANITYPTRELKRVLRSVYNRFRRLDDPAANAEARDDFVFHLTDWIDDLERLAALFAHPEHVDKKIAAEIVYAFLIHALPHLMEAGRLLEGKEIRNPFLSLSDHH
jgi:hypothetical protein